MSQERTDLGGGKGGIIRDGEEIKGDRVESAEDGEALPARGGAYEKPDD